MGFKAMFEKFASFDVTVKTSAPKLINIINLNFPISNVPNNLISKR